MTGRTHGTERLPEGLGEMGFVQQDQTAGAEQPRMDGLHAVGHAVSAEQQPGTHLVDGGAQNGGLRRRARPIVLQRRTAPKPLGDQRGAVLARQFLKTPGYLRDDPDSAEFFMEAVAKHHGDPLSAGKRIVHDKPPVHDERDGRRILRALDERCPERTVDTGIETHIRGVVVVLVGNSD